ncbi:MAG: AAA family ATPase [Pseudomonadota bacterium]
MITSLQLKFGSRPGAEKLLISQPSVTVFVGPNNSGKSQLLRDILRALRGGSQEGVLLDEVTLRRLSRNEAEEYLSAREVPPIPKDQLLPSQGVFVFSPGEQRSIASRSQLLNTLTDPKSPGHHFCSYYCSHLTAALTGEGRLALVANQKKGDLLEPVTMFARLLMDDDRREELREKIHDAVGLYFGLDAFQGDTIRIRFADSEPPYERSFGDETAQWMKSASRAEEVSDGVRAFTGILFLLAIGDPKAVVIDEPEAFLHPSLAFKLGQEVGNSVAVDGKQVFVATHSPRFLMGLVQSGAKVDIVRLTHTQGIATARRLPADKVQTLFSDPLLRSANVLEGLFHEHVIVAEADADRAFYQEINDRLLAASQKRGIPNCLFLNANGKQTLHKIVKPLRSLGIPAAAIADIDALNLKGTDWTNLMAGSGLPKQSHSPLGQQRKSIWEALCSNDKNPKIDGGFSLLSESERELAGMLTQQLQNFGLFIVPVGEVERWLADIEIPRSKHTWLSSIFSKMGHDPADTNYISPGSGDVWAFLELVRVWLTNPHRSGIPDQISPQT